MVGVAGAREGKKSRTLEVTGEREAGEGFSVFWDGDG